MTDPSAGDELMTTTVSVYQCPSNSRWEDITNRRDYAGCAGGRTWAMDGNLPVKNNFNERVYDDGVFLINHPRALKHVTDGTSQTIAIGEYVHAHRDGGGGGHGNENIGGPLVWYVGGRCKNPCQTSLGTDGNTIVV